MPNFIGEIRAFTYAKIPPGWKACDGQFLSTKDDDYTLLFSLIGFLYGQNGTDEFALPDLRGRVTIGAGSYANMIAYPVGDKGGIETCSLQLDNLARHNHTINAVDTPATQFSGTDGFLANAWAPLYGSINNVVDLSSNVIGPSGGDLPHNNVQPSTVCAFCIAYRGIYPQRS